MKVKGVLEKVDNWLDKKQNDHHTFHLKGEEKGFSAWGLADDKFKAGQTVEIEFEINGEYKNVLQNKLTKEVNVQILEEVTDKTDLDKVNDKELEVRKSQELVHAVLTDYGLIYQGVKAILGRAPEDISDGLTQVSTAYIELGKRRRGEKW